MQAKKPSFLSNDHALLTAMVQLGDPESCVTLIRNSAASGAEAFGIQLCYIEQKYKTEETYRYIFSRCGNKPIYITNYRQRENTGLTDDDLAEGMLLGLKAGATLVDVMGDLYDPSPLELTQNPAAIEKQRALIDRIHENGGEVLMSSHTWQYLTPEQILDITKAHEARGADITKIVTCANTEEELLSNFEAMRRMKKELNISFTFFELEFLFGNIFDIFAPFMQTDMAQFVSNIKMNSCSRSFAGVLHRRRWRGCEAAFQHHQRKQFFSGAVF